MPAEANADRIPHMTKAPARMAPATIRDRIRVRLDTLGLTPNAASLKAGRSRDFLTKLLSNPDQSIREDSLKLLAAALETSPAWLLGEVEEAERPRRANDPAVPMIPVYGLAAGALTGHHALTSDPIDEVDAPETLRHVVGAYALLTKGESMIPRYFPNDRLYVNPHQAVRPGDHVIVQVRLHDNSGTDTWIKRYDGETGDEILVSQYNPPSQIRFKRKYVTYVHRVLPINELFRR